MNVGLAIKVVRTERELTIEQLAKKLGISTSYLSLLENNKRSLSVGLLTLIGYTLHFRPSEILRKAEGYESPYVPSGDLDF